MSSVGVWVKSSNESGPPGTGIAFPIDVRGNRIGGMTFLHGIGPWGQPGFVTDREWIAESSAVAQFRLCIQNMRSRLAQSDAAEVAQAAPRIVWLHLSDISYLREIDRLWRSLFRPNTSYPIEPARIICVHPIRGSAKVELDVLLGDYDMAVFHVVANGERPGQYACRRHLDDLAPIQVVNEEEYDSPGWALNENVTLYARWDDAQGIWRGYTNFAKLYPTFELNAAGIIGNHPLNRAVAYSQRIQCEMNSIRGQAGMDSRQGGTSFQFTGWHPDGIKQIEIAGESHVGEQPPHTWVEWDAYPPGSVLSSEPWPYLSSSERRYFFSPQRDYIGPAWIEFRMMGQDNLWSRFNRIYIDVVPHLWFDTGRIANPFFNGVYPNPHGFSFIDLWDAQVGTITSIVASLVLRLGSPAPLGGYAVQLSTFGSVTSVTPASVVIPQGESFYAYIGVEAGRGHGGILAVGQGSPSCEYTTEIAVHSGGVI